MSNGNNTQNLPPEMTQRDERQTAPQALEVGPVHLSQELEHLIKAFAERRVRLREVLDVMYGRGYTMLLILLAFPFCTPIPLPGFSMPFGLVIAFIGLRLALLQKPWLPDWLLDKELPPRFFSRVLAATRRLAHWLERFLKPRYGAVLRWRLIRHLIGVMILVCGVLMLLPFPIPLSNGFPALTVLLLAAAMLEEDGYFAMAGAVMFLLTLAFFTAIIWGGAEVMELIRDYLSGILTPDDAVTP
jgi:hypothetical protein